MPDITLLASVAGAGKTTKLISIVEEELERGVPKDKIAFVSFTQEGAYVGRDRAIAKFGGKAEDYPYFRTLHSLAYHELGVSRFGVMNPRKYQQFGEMMGMRFWGHVSQDANPTDDDAYLGYYSVKRNNPRAAAAMLDGYDLDFRVLSMVTKCYDAFKKMNGLYDFTDFLEQVVERRLKVPVDVAVIDEAQDLTTLQWRAVWMLFQGAKRIYIAGDASQQIFAWAGSDERYFLSLKPTNPPIVLNYTYRCPASVTRYANKILKLIKNKTVPEMTSREEEGTCTMVNSLSELPLGNGENWLILARNNVFLDEVEGILKQKALIYTRDGKSSVNKKTLDLIKQYEKARKGELKIEEGSELARLIKECSSLDCAWFDALNLDPDLIDYYRSLFGAKAKDEGKIRLSTIHSCKGAECQNVVLISDMTTKTYKHLLKESDAELRCYYVAVTRAKEKLYIVAPQTTKHYPMLFTSGG